MMVKRIIDENKVAFLNFLFVFIFFYVELLQGGIATHDELKSIAITIEGSNKLALSARWGMDLFHYPVTLLQTSMPSYMLYRLWTIIGLMLACASAMIVIFHHIDKKICWIFPSIFVLLAQIELEHDGLFAFGWGYQFDIALVFISIDCFLLYKKTNKKKYNVWSILAYLVAVMSYEAFAAFGVLLLLIDILFMYAKKDLKLRNIINDLIFHFLAVFSYTISFIYLSHFYETGDASIGNSTSIVGYLETLKSYTIGLFPLRYNPYTLRQLLRFAFDISWENFALWMIIIIFTKTIINYIQKSKNISIKKYIAYSVIGLSGMILPNIVISLTSKFQEWTFKGVKTFGTSYYSYFFLIFLFVITMVFIYHRIRFKKCFMFSMFVIYIFTARFTLIANDYYLDILNRDQNRYEAFMDIIESDYFSKLPENVQIYTEDYIGIHSDMTYLSSLATNISGRQVRVLKDKTQIDWNLPVYYLDYDQQVEGIYLFNMIADEISDEVYVHLKNNIGHYYFLFHSYAYDVLPTYVNGEMVGAYRMNVIIPTLYTDSNNVLIQNKSIDTGSFEIQLGYNMVDSSIISFDGIYDIEDWGRWSQREFVVEIDNVNDEENCELTVFLAPGIKQNTKLNIEYSGKSEVYEIQSDGTELQLEIPLTIGANQINFNSEVENLDVPTDNRNLNMQIFKLEIEYDEKVYKYCK